MNRKILLMILDGWGLGTDDSVSAIAKANTPFMDSLPGNFPQSKLEASGLAVGLPEGQMGNSEVGHMNIGAGRVVYQDLVKVNKAVEEKTLPSLEVWKDTIRYVKEKGKALHLMGLLSDGGVHSHIEHLKGLLSFAHEAGLSDVYVHAFTDGRDTDPKGGKEYLADLISHMEATTGKLASITGRYFAMDRDKRWERVKLAYDAMVNGVGEVATSDPLAAVEASYKADVTDEFIKPIIVTNAEGTPQAQVQEGDAVIVFNFRTDRGRQITMALTQEDFPDFGMKKLPLHYVTMTTYDETFQGVKVLYGKDNLEDTLGAVLEKAGKKQIRIAETEKYPHVTFFFSGGREEPFEGEERILCPSPKVATYDLKPEMSAEDIRDNINQALTKEEVDFVCLNFANPDMVGHTGVFEAAVKACETADNCAKAVTETANAHGYDVIIIADHGNSDIMINQDGTPNTAHTTNLVPCFLVGNEVADINLKDGKLGDLAPTILSLMGIAVPKAMTGEVLLEEAVNA
ncbi:MAG: 2,3-bisphosphoglycerate-independent phosphoglycerate mutase [Bacteroidota bacterium]